MLYKYKPFYRIEKNEIVIDKHLIDSINKQEIYVPSYSSLNDPYETIYNYKPYQSYTAAEKQKLADIDKECIPGFENFGADLCKDMEAIDSGMNELKQEIINCDFGIFSLSEYNDNILMWSHYGDEHKGVCIGYDKKMFLDTESCIQVRYKKTIPIFDAKRNYRYPEFERYKYKFWAWNYEKEWRYLCVDHMDSVVKNPSMIKAIYFGLRVDMCTVGKELIEKIDSNIRKNIKFYHARLNHERFKLDFQEFHI
jgi:hypothetical protein